LILTSFSWLAMEPKERNGVVQLLDPEAGELLNFLGENWQRTRDGRCRPASTIFGRSATLSTAADLRGMPYMPWHTPRPSSLLVTSTWMMDASSNLAHRVFGSHKI
jgi:hypothetical protein